MLRGATPVDLGPAKQRAVLAVLLLQAGRPVPVHQIVDAVWGDDPPENGANVVQKYVAGLRRALDPSRAPRTPGELLALTGSGYVLRIAEATFDSDEFQAAVNRAGAERAAGRLAAAADALRAGLALWRGEALAGLTGPAFDAARIRLAEARATAWENWADIEMAEGRAGALVTELTRLVEEFPLREGLRAQLMIALHQSGRQAEALAVFRDAREYFLDEFGAEPGERMQEAHRKILRGEPFPAAAPVPDDPPPRPVSPPFVPTQFAPPGYGPPLAVPPTRRRVPVLEVLAAVLLPLVICSFGSWIYFVIAGIRRRDPWQYLVAAVYFAIFVVGVVIAFVVDPTPIDSDDTSTAEEIGFMILFVLPLASIFHGVVLATRANEFERGSALRGQARQFAQFAPDQARQIGIGRPAMMRGFDDGGLVDLNHVSGDELARATGLPISQAYGIVANRLQAGPFARPEDLVLRGLATERTVHRLAQRLICIPVGPAPAWRPPPR